MMRVWGHVLAGLSLVAGVTAAGSMVAACVHDDSTIFVNEVLAPQFVTPGMACTFTADPTQLHITSGALDTGITSSYNAVFLVGNQIVPRGNPNQPQTETSYVNIQGAVVRILDSDGITAYVDHLCARSFNLGNLRSSFVRKGRTAGQHQPGPIHLG